jgi:hypothetical protein
VTNPGYLTPPGTVGYFFGGRGNFKLDDITRTDLALNYRINLVRGIQLFVQPEVINLFNEQGAEDANDEVLTALNNPTGQTYLLPFNPFTQTPVECPQSTAIANCQQVAPGSNFKLGDSYGRPDSEGDYQTPRTFRISVGLRF